MMLNFLNPQYKQIVDAGNHLNLFIKGEKVSGGLFDANADQGKSLKHPDKSEVMSQGLFLLDEYVCQVIPTTQPSRVSSKDNSTKPILGEG
jgi:hypothetical protein